MLWLSDRTITLVLVVGATNSWTYVVTLGCSSSMAGHLVKNKRSSFAWQIGVRSIVDYIVGSHVI